MPVLRRLYESYRRTGADPPFGDPRRAHGVGMEGYYWRLTDPAARRVVIVLCGVCAAADGRWAVVALAAHPDGVVRHAVVPVATADPYGLGVRAGDVLVADADRLRVDLGVGARADVRFPVRLPWPHRVLGGLGLGQIVPGLGQYWHPHMLGGTVAGHAELGGDRTVDLGAAVPYAEKNWGSRFADTWWWGQAQGFGGDDVCVAFAGGRLSLGRAVVAPTALVVRIGADVVRLAPPAARTVAAVGVDGWRLRSRRGDLEAELLGWGAGSGVLLPVPIPRERRTEPRSHQVLAGGLELSVRRGARVVYRGESTLAGLERDAG